MTSIRCHRVTHERKSRPVLTLLLLLCNTVALTQGASDSTFAAWHTKWLTERQSQDGDDALAAAKAQGIREYFHNTRAAVAVLAGDPMLTQRETQWANNFLKVMDVTAVPLVTNRPDEILAEIPPSRDPVRKAKDLSGELRLTVTGDPFDVSNPTTMSGDFVIFQGTTNEILIPGNSESRAAQTLFRTAAKLHVVLRQSNLPAMVAVNESIARAKQRWDNFVANAISDQFPWETSINGALASIDKNEMFSGTLAYPPRLQLRLAHPFAAEAVAVEGESTFVPRMVIEAIGIRRFAAETYEPVYGFSLVAIPKLDSEESWGYGIVYTRRVFSAGLVVQDLEQGDDTVQIVLGLKFSQLLKQKAIGLKQRLAAVKDRLEIFGHCFSNTARCPAN